MLHLSCRGCTAEVRLACDRRTDRLTVARRLGLGLGKVTFTLAGDKRRRFIVLL